jgi:hypothetical protein
MAKGSETYNSGASSVIYGMGFIGSVFYFLQHATNFWDGCWGILQSFVWPAILVYQAFLALKY